MKLSWTKKNHAKQNEVFNLKNKNCKKNFKEETKCENNNYYLSSVFDNNEDLNKQTKQFLTRLNKTIAKCFKKVRVVEKVDKKKDELFKEWKYLKNKTDEKSRVEREKVEEELSKQYAEEYVSKIKEKTAGIDCDDGGINSG